MLTYEEIKHVIEIFENERYPLKYCNTDIVDFSEFLNCYAGIVLIEKKIFTIPLSTAEKVNLLDSDILPTLSDFSLSEKETIRILFELKSYYVKIKKEVNYDISTS